MKTIKFFLTTLFTFAYFFLYAQSPTADGIYSSKYGTVNLSTEWSDQFPEGSVVYGDYREDGTITGARSRRAGAVVIAGQFFNGSSFGKFVFRPVNRSVAHSSFSELLKGLTGYWGYDSDHDYSSDPNDEWKAELKESMNMIKNKTNVWTGKWNTNDGPMYLWQNGNKVEGKYKGVGTITGIYNYQTNILKGKFTNNATGEHGFLEFFIRGNKFEGKWGWTSEMKELNWDGTKELKNNSNLGTGDYFTNQVKKQVKPYNVDFRFDYISEKTHADLEKDVYGIGWCRLVVKDKNTKQEITVQPASKPYIDKNGRVFEIPRDRSVILPDRGAYTLMNDKIRFTLHPEDYGYSSPEEMYSEAWFEVAFEAKVKGFFSDNIVGKQRVKIYLKEANIVRAQESDLVNTLSARPISGPGRISIMKGDFTFIIYYSFIPASN